MCGIAGMIDLTGDNRSAPAGAVERMAQALFHRGPDDDGFLPGPGLHLANRRLSIVGLKDGKQPIANEDRTVWTVFNGELYDYAESRKNLEARGHTFRTGTDTELIPHLWEEHREKFLDHIKGQFAICVWDSRTNEFLLARDRAGICPLFFTTAQRDGGPWLLFASEIKGLLASGFVDAKPDVQGLNHVFTFFAMPGPQTVFQGVTSLPPGQFVQFTPGRGSPETLLKRRTYWQVTYPDRGDEVDGDEAPIVQGFAEALERSVRRRLTADVPVVSYLSGGVDSSLIVAMATKILGRPIPTFTVSVQGDGLNEEAPARVAAKHVNCDPVIVRCGHEELRAGYPELVRAAEFPVIDTSCLGLMHLARSVREHGYKVALTGEGADEWLGGYSWFKLDRLFGWTERLPGGFPLGYYAKKLAMRFAGHPMYPRHIVRKVQKYVGGHNGWMDVYGMMSLSKLRFFTPDVTEQLVNRSPYEDLELSPDRHRWHPFNRQMYLGARIMLPGHLLTCKGDRVSMHNSVEGRYPFLDEDVINYMAKLHPRWKLRSLRRDKYVERKAAEAWLPPEVAWRRKFMFVAPMDSWASGMKTAGTADAWVEQVLSPESIRKTGLFEHAAVQSAREQLLTTGRRAVGRTGLAMGLTAVVATQLWHHLYVRGDLADIPGASSG